MLTPSKKTSTIVLVLDAPLIINVLSEVMPSLVLLPVSSLIIIIRGGKGLILSIVIGKFGDIILVFPAISVA